MDLGIKLLLPLVVDAIAFYTSDLRVCNVRVIFDRVTVFLELFVSSKT